MVITDSPYHITFSSAHTKPSLACTGKCKKVWWDFDYENTPDHDQCLQCGGILTGAVEGVHFKILKIANRSFRPKDFKGFKEIGREDQKELARLVNGKVFISHMSKVKDKFVEKAKREWV